MRPLGKVTAWLSSLGDALNVGSESHSHFLVALNVPTRRGGYTSLGKIPPQFYRFAILNLILNWCCG